MHEDGRFFLGILDQQLAAARNHLSKNTVTVITTNALVKEIYTYWGSLSFQELWPEHRQHSQYSEPSSGLRAGSVCGRGWEGGGWCKKEKGELNILHLVSSSALFSVHTKVLVQNLVSCVLSLNPVSVIYFPLFSPYSTACS